MKGRDVVPWYIPLMNMFFDVLHSYMDAVVGSTNFMGNSPTLMHNFTDCYNMHPTK